LYDAESNLFYFGARYYDPETGRFLTNDPVAGDALNPPSLHKYLYAYDSPMVYTDPWGETSLGEWVGDFSSEQFSKEHWWSNLGGKAAAIGLTALHASFEFASVGAVGKIDRAQEQLDRGEIDRYEYIEKVSYAGAGTVVTMAAGGAGGALAARGAAALGLGIEASATVAGVGGGLFSQVGSDVLGNVTGEQKGFSSWKAYAGAGVMGGAFGWAEGVKYKSQAQRSTMVKLEPSAEASEIRVRVEKNIAESKAARESSKFNEYAQTDRAIAPPQERVPGYISDAAKPVSLKNINIGAPRIGKGLGDATTSPWLADPRPGIAEHLERFREGGSFFVPENMYNSFIKGKAMVGRPDGQFIFPKSVADNLVQQANGNLAALAQAAGQAPEAWKGPLYRVDVSNPLLYNARFPSGLESGANAQFRWGVHFSRASRGHCRAGACRGNSSIFGRGKIAMKTLLTNQEEWFVLLWDERNNAYYLEVACGGAAMVMVRLQMNPEEARAYKEDASNLSLLAAQVRKWPERFAGRLFPA
jgi:RHS repeat-associated protein